MNDERLTRLDLPETVASAAPAIRLTNIKLVNYKFFHGPFELRVDGKSALIYGDNGSGKSSIYKALELLTRRTFADFPNQRNIFADPAEEAEVEFAFSNGQTFTITADTEEIPSHVNFLRGLAVFVPMLDYKKLLKVHYAPNAETGNINLYSMLRYLLKDYPVRGESISLNEIKDFNRYFNELDRIVNQELLAQINSDLEMDFKVESFEFRTEIADEKGALLPIINMIIQFKDKQIRDYHVFLNEARLSALAIAVYFASIKKMMDTVQGSHIKLLVLDDLLISLDMSNRLKLLDILKRKFADFQLFFFTHDKELFEFYKEKMEWEKFELYLDDTDSIQKVILKKGQTELERAKEFFANKDYDCCALLLRKAFEKILKKYLTPQEQRDRNCNDLDLSGLIGKAISKSNDPNKAILKKLDSDRRHILNPLSHSDTRNIYAEELKSAMADLEQLKTLLSGS